MTNFPKLQNQPLRIVLADFIFSEVLQINEYIPEFQESIRHLFPVVLRNKYQDIIHKQNEIEVKKSEITTFMSADNKEGVQLGVKGLVYFTTDYPRFDGFSERCKDFLEKLVAIVNPSLLIRIGLRYSNTVDLESNDNVKNFIASDYRSPSDVNNVGQVAVYKSEHRIVTREGLLLFRTVYGMSPSPLLPDLRSLPIKHDDSENKRRLFFDFDHIYDIVDNPSEFKVAFIIDKLSALHEISRKAFWEITTDEAREKRWS